MHCFGFPLQLESHSMSSLIISFKQTKSIKEWRIVGRGMCIPAMTTDKLCRKMTRPVKVHLFSITNPVLFASCCGSIVVLYMTDDILCNSPVHNSISTSLTMPHKNGQDPKRERKMPAFRCHAVIHGSERPWLGSVHPSP